MRRVTVVYIAIAWICCDAFGTNENCGNNTYGPVGEGVDFVDLLNTYNQNNELIAPQKGFAEYSVEYRDYTFWFLNNSNADSFKSNPIKYAPKYGCFCSWTLTGNDPYCPIINNNTQTWCIGPLCTWTDNGYGIYNQTIYCFCGSGAKADFNYKPNAQQNIESADQNWIKYIQQQNVENCYNTQYFNNNTECLPSSSFFH